MSAFSSKVKISSKKGETLLLQTDLSRSNSVIPRSIQWKEINLPDEWVLEGVVQPKPTKPNEPLEPNTRLKHIEQFHDGKVKLSFIRNHHETIDDYTCESSSLPETIDLGRVSQLAQDFSRMENCPKFQPRFSTSDIPNSVLRNVDFRTKIPKPVYKAESSFQHNDFSPKSEPTSPTFSAVTDNMIKELNVLEKDFQIDKEFLQNKKPIFKHFQISSSSVKTYQETNKEFIRALQSQQSKIDIGENNTPQESDIRDTPTSKAQINTLANESYSSETSEQNSTPEINRLGRENHQDHQIISAPDLGQIQIIYDWNIDGISEYNILNFLQKMTMAANAYRTQVGNEDRTVAELLIAGFSSQLKGWWDNYLNNQQRSEILDAVKTDEDNEIPQYLGIRTLNSFQTLNAKGLVISNVRNKSRDSTGTQIIDYDDFTYGELISIFQQEGLKICQDLKLQKHLKWELKRTKVELGSFCRQFEIDPSKNSKSCIGDCSNSYYSKNKPRKYSKTYRNHKSHENSWQKPHHSSSSSNDSDSSLSYEKALQVDELKNSSSGSESDENKINVLTKDQEFQIEILNSISNPQTKQNFLETILSSLNEKEIKISENTSKPHNPTSSKSSEITSRKYKIKITLVFSENYKIDTIALFNTGADLNCIKSGLVPKCFHLETREKLSAANNSKLRITSKAEASILKDNTFIKTTFVLTDDIYHNVILGTPFINLITPYKVMDDSISFKTQNKKTVFSIS
ncbi:hypothetical protein EUTSA_v10001275mg [Eutrema salsugineum]|uniref:DUF7746 domain-containing protein n=1 Tax=Eutrema salsugineum TaxID=72664 RepID=V4KNQ4_EUTSA|nr:hypothetical protein EUTSA_v10001275mg [Eutrema salsugineum]